MFVKKEDRMFEQKVLSEINRYQLISRKSRLLVGVSGGPDSLVLLHFLMVIKRKIGARIRCCTRRSYVPW